MFITFLLFYFAVLCIQAEAQYLLSFPWIYSHVAQYYTTAGLNFFRYCIPFPFFEKKKNKQTNDLLLQIARCETNLLVTVVILTCPIICTLPSNFENVFDDDVCQSVVMLIQAKASYQLHRLWEVFSVTLGSLTHKMLKRRSSASPSRIITRTKTSTFHSCFTQWL